LILAATCAPCTAVTVTVSQRAPLESLSASGDVTGVTEAQAGAQYMLVTDHNGQLIVRDAQGNEYQIATAATDYVPPPPAPTTAAAPAHNPVPAAASTNSVATAKAPPAATNAVVAATPPPAPSAATTPVDTSALTVATVNAALGKPLFSDQPLWQETALMVALRVGLALEGRTQWEASYRRYFSGQPDDPKALVLSNGAYCIAVYADAEDHPTSVLIAFANDGDFHGIGSMATDLEGLAHGLNSSSGSDLGALRTEYTSKLSEALATFEPVRAKEQQSLTAKLTSLFGDPQQTSFGSDPTTKENTLRWDWNGASFLLSCQPNKYDLLRIVPTELADKNGRAERIPRDDIGHKLSAAVEHRDNGDVVITQLPMADQGFKAYCVPATWERVLRYTGVPGDMYTLSRVGTANFDEGENGLDVAQQLDKMLYDYGRHVEVLNPSHLDYIAVRHYIDDGVPIFWSVNPAGYEPAEQRYSLCDREKDFDTWKKLLDQARATQDWSPLAWDGGHQVLIIGYNADTKELAWTDPWGRTTRERWMTQEEAQHCTLGQYYVITW
jgi:hypothetical protein